MQQITHNNHYVPQFYLKNWSYDEKSLYVYNILVSDRNVPLWSKKTIKNIAYNKDFYTREFNGCKIDDIEQWLNTQFEMPIKGIIEKVKKDERLDSSDWQCLIRFMAAQQLRTPAKLNDFLVRWQTEMPILFQKTLEKVKAEIEKPEFVPQNKTFATDTNLIPIKLKLDDENGVMTVKSIIGKGMYLFALKHLLTNTINKVLVNHQWHIIHAPNDLEWPTSDDPVICLNYYDKNNYDFKGGWNRKNGEIIFPLTPKHILYTQIGNHNKRCTLDYSYKYGLLIQRFIIEHAHRYVFARTPLKEMLKLRPRKVSSSIYKEEFNALRDWHTEQTKHEKEIME